MGTSCASVKLVQIFIKRASAGESTEADSNVAGMSLQSIPGFVAHKGTARRELVTRVGHDQPVVHGSTRRSVYYKAMVRREPIQLM